MRLEEEEKQNTLSLNFLSTVSYFCKVMWPPETERRGHTVVLNHYKRHIIAVFPFSVLSLLLSLSGLNLRWKVWNVLCFQIFESYRNNKRKSNLSTAYTAPWKLAFKFNVWGDGEGMHVHTRMCALLLFNMNFRRAELPWFPMASLSMQFHILSWLQSGVPWIVVLFCFHFQYER